MSEDEQTAVNFQSVWVTACHDAAAAICENEQFLNKVETFVVADKVPPTVPGAVH